MTLDTKKNLAYGIFVATVFISYVNQDTYVTPTVAVQQQKPEGDYLLKSGYSDKGEGAQKEVDSLAERIDLIQSVLGVNNTQFATVMGITRGSVYNHKKEKEVPNQESLDRYNMLYELVRVLRASMKEDFALGIKSIFVNNKTLLQRLQEPKINMKEFMEAAKIVAEKTSHRKRPTKEMQFKASGSLTTFG